MQATATREGLETRAYYGLLTGNARPADEIPSGESVVVFDTGPYFRQTQPLTGVTWVLGTHEFKVYSFGMVLTTLPSEAALLEALPGLFADQISEGVIGGLG